MKSLEITSCLEKCSIILIRDKDAGKHIRSRALKARVHTIQRPKSHANTKIIHNNCYILILLGQNSRKFSHEISEKLARESKRVILDNLEIKPSKDQSKMKWPRINADVTWTKQIHHNELQIERPDNN